MLKLAHHKHTGKLLPHHHTSYRGLSLVLLVMGVALVSMQSVAHASFMDLSAKISGPIPTVAAVITSPTDGTKTSNSNLAVKGTCQDMSPPTIIIIYIDDNNAGSTVCQAGGTFYINVTLAAGTHTLIAKTSNSTDDLGPDSSPIHVTYKPKAPPSSSSNANTGSTTGSSGNCTPKDVVRINSTTNYLEYGRLLAANWEFSISGGCAPYRVTIDWGDGLTDTITVRDNELLTARHGYAELKPYYQVSLSVISADKQTAKFSTVAVTPYIPPVTAGGLVQVDTPFILSFQGSLLRAYLAYLAALAIFGIAWYDKHIKRVRLAGLHVFPLPPAGKRRH